MEFLGLSPIEIVVIVVVAILVFGQRLPQVAGETAATLQKVKRSLADLRRETGIDQEIYRAKREFEEASRKARAGNPIDTVKREVLAARAEIRAATTDAPNTNASSSTPTISPAVPELGAPPAPPQTPPATQPRSTDPGAPDRG